MPGQWQRPYAPPHRMCSNDRSGQRLWMPVIRDGAERIPLPMSMAASLGMASLGMASLGMTSLSRR